MLIGKEPLFRSDTRALAIFLLAIVSLFDTLDCSFGQEAKFRQEGKQWISQAREISIFDLPSEVRRIVDSSQSEELQRQPSIILDNTKLIIGESDNPSQANISVNVFELRKRRSNNYEWFDY